MNNTIPGTVCCILCRGMVIYKDGDKSRFKNHMNNEHGAFFDIDYLLASCLLENDQKAAVAKTVECTKLLGTDSNYAESGVTLTEATEKEVNVDHLVLKKEKFDEAISDLQSEVQFGTQEAYIEPSKKEFVKKDTKKKTIECDICGKYFTSAGHVRHHKEKMHNIKDVESTIKQERNEDTGVERNIPFQRYDDPSMDPSNLYQRMPEETSEMVTNNEETSYYNNGGVFEENNSPLETEEFPINESQSTSIPPPENDLDQLLSEVRKRNADVLDYPGDDHQDDAEKVNGADIETHAASDRYTCEFESCGKAYTNKSNRNVHMKKAHNMVATKTRKKMKAAADQERDQDFDLENKEKENSLRWDELEKIRAQYYNKEEVPPIVDTNNTEETKMSSFLTDTSMGFDEVKDVEQGAPNQQQELPSETIGVDLSQSKYFAKNPKVITAARGKSLSLFNEIPTGLSENWKMRTFEVTTKTGDKSMIKHYLTPEFKVLKTGLAVVEYLRLKGEMDNDQLKEISNFLNIPEKKLRSLYD